MKFWGETPKTFMNQTQQSVRTCVCKPANRTGDVQIEMESAGGCCAMRLALLPRSPLEPDSNAGIGGKAGFVSRYAKSLCLVWSPNPSRRA